jgi:hypothetical protein
MLSINNSNYNPLSVTKKAIKSCTNSKSVKNSTKEIQSIADSDHDFSGIKATANADHSLNPFDFHIVESCKKELRKNEKFHEIAFGWVGGFHRLGVHGKCPVKCKYSGNIVK